MQGWIKLHRKLWDSWIWKDARLRWWLDLLLLANHKPNTVMVNGRRMRIDVGEHLTSEVKLAARWEVDRKRVRRFFRDLEADGMISLDKNFKTGTRVRITNYALYQHFYDQEGTADATANATANGTAKEQQTPHKQEVKNDKNEENEKNEKIFLKAQPPAAAGKKESSIPSLQEVKDYCKAEGKSIDAEQFYYYYEALGWQSGRSQIKNWRAAVSAWERNGNSGSKNKDSVTNYDELL